MRHRKAGRNLGRRSSHRKAMLRNMVTSLFKHEQLETTDAKAKELRIVAERMIGLAKRGDLHSRRQALAYIQDKAATHKLFEELKERYLDRQGGYVRTVKKGTRKGDGAPVSVIQLLPAEQGKKKTKKKGKPAVSAGKARPKPQKKAKAKEPSKPSPKGQKEEVKGTKSASSRAKKDDSD
jgi:large subunit ribosomal protein L17